MNLWRWFQPVSFQLIWLTGVLVGNRGLLLILMILWLHFALSPCRRGDMRILPLGLIGIVMDMFLTQLNVFEFDARPLWLPLLWFALVLNFGHSLIFLRRLKLPWLMLIGSLGGCYAYLASWSLGAVVFPQGPWMTAFLLMGLWAVIFPLLVKVDHFLREK